MQLSAEPHGEKNFTLHARWIGIAGTDSVKVGQITVTGPVKATGKGIHKNSKIGSANIEQTYEILPGEGDILIGIIAIDENSKANGEAIVRDSKTAVFPNPNGFGIKPVIKRALVGFWAGDNNLHDWVSRNDGQFVNLASGKTGYKNFDGTFALDSDAGFRGFRTYYDKAFDPDSLTISAWVKLSESGGSIVDKTNMQRSSGYSLQLYGNRLLLQYYGNHGEVNLYTNDAFQNTGEWCHITSVLAPSKNRREIYINGKIIATHIENGFEKNLPSDYMFPTVDKVNKSEVSISIGTNIKGAISSVAIYNDDLSPDDIDKIYKAGRLRH